MPRINPQDDGTGRLVPGESRPPRDVPALPQDGQLVPPAVRGPLEALRAAVQTLLGTRGDPLDKALTLRSAQERGIIDLEGRFLGGGTTIIQSGGGGGTGGGTTPEKDLTPPPNVTNLRASAGFTNVIVEWDLPAYTQGHGHAKTNLYAVKKDASDPTLPTAGDAVRVAEATGALTIFALPSEMGVRWHLWAKFETRDGVESIAFAGGANGVQATTAQDNSRLLAALSGSITGSHLYASLRGRPTAIERVDTEQADNDIAAALAAYRAGRGAAAQDAILRQDLQDAAGAAAAQTGAVRQDVAIVRQDMGVLANHVGAQWTVRMLLASGGKTLVGGVGLAGSNAGAAGPTIDFGVLANRFYVGAPDDGSNTPGVFPFVVQTTDTTVNGQLIEKGTYVDGLKVNNLQAMIARLGTAWVDDAKIANLSAAKLTAGDGTIGGNLKSANYVGGPAGWIVRPDGYAEFSNVVIRGASYSGSVFSGSGTIGGFTIGSTDLRSTNYVPATSGLRFNANGYAELNNVYARGDIQATSLNAATGTFSGTLTAGSINIGSTSTGAKFYDPLAPSVDLPSLAKTSIVLGTDTATDFAVLTGADATLYCCVPIDADVIHRDKRRRRVRSGLVSFVVNASASVSKYLSVWYRVQASGGAWGPWYFAAGDELSSPSGAITNTSLHVVVDVFSMSPGDIIQFGLAPLDYNGRIFQGANGQYLLRGNLLITASNF